MNYFYGCIFLLRVVIKFIWEELTDPNSAKARRSRR